MNLYETEALTIDPERRRGESTAADVFVFFLWFFFVLFSSGFINVHGAFFLRRVSVLWKKKKQARRNKNTRLLCFIHFMLEPVETLLHQEALTRTF